MSDSLRPRGLYPTRFLCPWISQARILKWAAFPALGDLPNPAIKPRALVSPGLADRFFTTAPAYSAKLTKLK